MEMIKGLLEGDILGKLLMGLVVVNILLSAAGSIFAAIGKSEKAPAWLAKMSEIVAKLIDFASANRKH